MTREIRPGEAPEIPAKLYNAPKADFAFFEKEGDAQIKAANKNFKLYAEMLVASESAKVFEQFKNDPINLTNALGKLPEMLSDLPQEVQDDMQKKIYLNNASLVQKAENNRIALIDKENKANADYVIDVSRSQLTPAYVNLLQNNNTPADNKQPILNDIFLAHVDNLQTLSELKKSNGEYAYSDQQKKAIKNISDVELAGFKQYVDGLILNDNQDLEKTKEYYQTQVLAPERFMKESYMDSDTYDKARTYMENRMKQAGVEIKNMRFNQSVQDAMALQLVDTPGKIKALKESGYIDSALIDSIENANVKFNNIDPSKAELPTTMLEMLDIVNGWSRNPVAQTEEQKLAILAQGTSALDSIAEFGQKYGLTPKSVNQARQMIVMKEQDMRYNEMLDNFGRITQSFGKTIPNMREKMNFVRGVNGGSLKGVKYEIPSDREMIKLGKLNIALAIADDASREALRNGDIESYNKIQAELPQTVAKIKYSGIISDADWANWQVHPDTPIKVGTQYVKILGFTPDGDVKVEK